ncbi:MAG TPA: FAD-dependent monooxygenase, partial [Candidatus Polarisedimenticolia bacterium]|nr:FAD-dependent monooxygenase [Candidatus Polarisedimenticolia bacterium]
MSAAARGAGPGPVAVVGAGRAGLGLARALRSAGVRVSVIGRDRKRLRRAVPAARIVVIAVADAALGAAASTLARLPLQGKVVLHLSGARGASALAAARS